MKVSPIVIREDEILATAARDLEALDQARVILGADGFTVGDNPMIWAAMLALSDRGRPANELSALAATIGEKANIGRLQWLLGDKAPRVQPGRLITLCSEQRRYASAVMIRAQAGALSSVSDLDVFANPDAIYTAAEALRGSATRGMAGGLKTPAELAKQLVQRMLDRSRDGGVPAAPTGIIPLDAVLDGGLQRKRMYVDAGRPAMGKTALAWQSAINMATLGHPVLYYSREMDAVDMTDRAVQVIGRLDGFRPGNPGAIEQNGRDWFAALSVYSRLSCLWVEDTVRDLAEALARARAWIRTDATRVITESENGKMLVPVVVLDYLQRFGLAGKFGSREAEVAAMSSMCADFALDEDCAVKILCQVNRDNVKGNRPPGMADLRESGAIEQDARAIMFVHRDTTPTEGADDRVFMQAKIIVDKNTFGPTGALTVGWRPRSTRFESYPPIDEP